MKFRRYTPSYFRYLLQAKDWPQYGIGTEQDQIDANITRFCEVLNGEAYQFHDFHISRRKGNLIFRATRLEDKVCLRHISSRLKRHYQIVSEDRKRIVDQITCLLESDVPLKIVRTDIENFFASIDFEKLLDRIETDGVLSSRNLHLLKMVQDRVKEHSGTGVPWGLSVSSMLAEIYMQEVDAACRSVPGVYYYARYVDDIIIFCSQSVDDIVVRIENELQKLNSNLRLSERKTKRITESAFPLVRSTRLEYLGYRFERYQKNKKRCAVSISISKKKFNRIKAKLVKAFFEFERNHLFQDLKDRLKLLTGASSINRADHAAPIRIGLSANYGKINDTRQLLNLDKILNYEVRGALARRSASGARMMQKRLRTLFKYSFLKSFERGICHTMTRNRIQHAYRIWNHGN